MLSRWGIECLSPSDSVETERKRNIPGNCADESWPALAPTDDSGVSKYIYRVSLPGMAVCYFSPLATLIDGLAQRRQVRGRITLVQCTSLGRG